MFCRQEIPILQMRNADSHFFLQVEIQRCFVLCGVSVRQMIIAKYYHLYNRYTFTYSLFGRNSYDYTMTSPSTVFFDQWPIRFPNANLFAQVIETNMSKFSVTLIWALRSVSKVLLWFEYFFIYMLQLCLISRAWVIVNLLTN